MQYPKTTFSQKPTSDNYQGGGSFYYGLIIIVFVFSFFLHDF